MGWTDRNPLSVIDAAKLAALDRAAALEDMKFLLAQTVLINDENQV